MELGGAGYRSDDFMRKRCKRLSLDAVALERGERYCEFHQTNLSPLVNDFLAGLPLNEPTNQLAPIVSRLLGLAAKRNKRRSGSWHHGDT